MLKQFVLFDSCNCW